MEFQDLLAPVAGQFDIENELQSWRWLMPDHVNGLVATALGDLFVARDDGTVWFLDTIEGKYEEAASSIKLWEDELKNPGFVDRYFTPVFVRQLRESGLILGQGECYEAIHPPVLGGSWSVENWRTTNWKSHFERQGRVHEAIKDLPDGATIEKWNYTKL